MNLQRRAMSAVPWAFLESALNALTGLLSTLIIGRLISPSELGKAGVAFAVISLVEICAAFGIADTLIRSRSTHTSLTDSAFVGLLGLSLIGAAVCCCLAAPVGWLYDDVTVTHLILVSSFLVPLAAIDTVPAALLTRKMRIDVLAKRGIASKVIALLVNAGLGYLGYGAWSIVWSTFIGSALASIMLFSSLTRLPRLRMNWGEFRGLISFGGLISLELLLVSVTTRLFALLFGVFHGLAALGYLQFAQRLVDEVAALIQSFAFRFALSYFGSLERTEKAIAPGFLFGTRVVTVVATPILLGLASVAHDAIAAVIGDQWLPAANLVVIAALSWSLAFPTTLVSPALRARGRQRPMVLYSFASCALALAACVLTAQSTIVVAASAWSSRNFLAIPAGAWIAKRHLGVAVPQFVSAFLGPLLCGFAMLATIFFAKTDMTAFGAPKRLVVEITLGIAVYVALVGVVERPLWRRLLTLRRERRAFQ